MTSIPSQPSIRMHSATPRWYHLAVAFFILQSSEAFSVIDRLRYGEWEGKTSDQLIQTLNLLQIVVSIFLFWRGYSKSKKLSLGATLLLTLMGYLLISALWSVDPQTSLRRAIEYLFFALALIGIANSVSGDEYMLVMRRVILLAAIGSLVLLVISPHSVLMSDGPIRGVFTHKNVLGQVMAAGVLACLHGMRAGDGDRRACAAMIIVFAALTFFASSATSLMTIFVFCGAEIFMAVFRRKAAASAIMIVISITAFVTFVLSPELILDLLGKDATLTGRTDLWEYVKICISQRPLLGWGFNAFWLSINPAAAEISTNLGWIVPQAHNGLLELLLEVGVVGTSFFAIIFVRSIWIAVRCLQTPAKDLGKTLLLCCGGILVVGVSEEVLVDPSQISVGIFFVLGLTGERMLRGAAQQQRFRGVEALLQPAATRSSL